jgi:hypothetical protein
MMSGGRETKGATNGPEAPWRRRAIRSIEHQPMGAGTLTSRCRLQGKGAAVVTKANGGEAGLAWALAGLGLFPSRPHRQLALGGGWSPAGRQPARGSCAILTEGSPVRCVRFASSIRLPRAEHNSAAVPIVDAGLLVLYAPPASRESSTS